MTPWMMSTHVCLSASLLACKVVVINLDPDLDLDMTMDPDPDVDLPHLQRVGGLWADEAESVLHDALLVVHLDGARDEADGVARALFGVVAPAAAAGVVRRQLVEEVVLLAVVVQQAVAVEHKVTPLPGGHRRGAALVQEPLRCVGCGV